MAETDNHELQNEAKTSSDDEFEMVVRKKHSSSHKLRHNGGGSQNYRVGGGDRDFRNNRNFRRRNFHGRDFKPDSIKKTGERDKDKHQQNNAVPTPQQPPTSHIISNDNNNHSSTSSSISIISAAATNGSSHYSSVGKVANGSVCSESESSSESFINGSTNGLLEITDVHQEINHSRHVSGGSISGSASTCDIDIAQESLGTQFVYAPPPPINPWRANANAASVIAKKLIPAIQNNNTNNNNSKLPTMPKQEKDTMTALNKQSCSNAKKKKGVPPTSANNSKNMHLNNSQDDSSVDKHKPVNVQEVSSSSQENSTYFGAKKDTVIQNGAVAETSSLKKELVVGEDQVDNVHHISLPKSPIAVDLNLAHVAPQETPCLESESEIIIAPAPPPAVNPWHANKNAVSVIGKKAIANFSAPTPQSKPVTETVVPQGDSAPIISNKNSVKPLASSQVKMTNKDNTPKSPTTTTTTTTSANGTSQNTKDQQRQNTKNDNATTAPASVVPTPPLQKDTPKFSRGFAAVTKQQLGKSSNPTLTTSRNSSEDWPSLQDAVVVVVATPVAPLVVTQQAKPVIQMTNESKKKMTGATSTINNETATATSNSETEDNTVVGVVVKKTNNSLPSSGCFKRAQNENGKETGTESGWLSGSGTDDAKSETSTEESVELVDKNILPTTQGIINQKNKPNEESSSTTSSDDQEGRLLDNELEEGGANGGNSKKSKRPKQKWVKLDLPETPTTKSRLRKERQSMERGDKESQHNKDANNGSGEHKHDEKSKTKVSSNYNNNYNNKITNGHYNNQETNNRSNHTYPPRGRGRVNNGIRGRSGGRGARNNSGQYWAYQDSEIIISVAQPTSQSVVLVNGGGGDFQDYATDYTTLPPLYPMNELNDFVMPYANEDEKTEKSLEDTTATDQPNQPTPTEPAPAYYSPEPTVVIPIASFSPPIVIIQTPIQQDAPTQIKNGPCLPSDPVVLMEMVKKQIEYYFSEENLAKDFYLRRKMDHDGFLPISFIATFPRLKVMTQDSNAVVQAIQSSAELELSNDHVFVRTRNDPRKWPIINDPSQGIAAPTRPITLSHAHPNNNNNNDNSLSPSSSGTHMIKLDPEVPEFVPKFNSNVSLTA